MRYACPVPRQDEDFDDYQGRVEAWEDAMSLREERLHDEYNERRNG